MVLLPNVSHYLLGHSILGDMSNSVNYADLFGFKSIPAAVIFAICYVPLCCWFIPKVIVRRTYVVFTVTLFCFMRVSAFILRVILIASESVGENESVFITDEVLFSIGFFGLLFGAYGLVLDRLSLLTTSKAQTYPLSFLIQNRKLFHLVLTAGMIMGIIGITNSTSSTPSSSGSTLRKASVIVFVVLTILQAYQTFVLVMLERSENPEALTLYLGHSIGARHGAMIFVCISVLLLVREVYMLATIGSSITQNKEYTWYPLVALPELVCVTLYALPGIIPPPAGSQIYDLPR
ncbi:hypothetical protein F5890DRAFT_1523855 [Lentinula detonsa]|uniref:DUF7702 domain-containing protein n=1 Tax=Lentinula detonsa TaxID=2804962 RepID=A0AA38PY21_9AGAR|nr:hypothetical protein F5890DRAFT_1523855 [Lentinula detonsa]